MANEYRMTISRMTVDKLGVKLYDRVSAVIAELVSNSYDADATEVTVIAPMGEWLAAKNGKEDIDKGFFIEVSDNGIGMTPEEVNEFYLKVGAERRNDSRRGELSRKFKRKVMGRKGVGKLAPFGICEKIEILTSGGEPVEGFDENGEKAVGYLTAHLHLNRSDILSDSDDIYIPVNGALDGIVRPVSGTSIKMTFFAHRRVPEIEEFERQLSQRFGLTSHDWKLILKDSTKSETDDTHKREVGQFVIAKMPHTEIRFEITDSFGNETYPAYGPDNNIYTDVRSGFEHDGKFYPVTGWVAYSKEAYKDDLMAGVRIYCRKKIAAQTNIFNRGAGFTGEHTIRSYLIGELHADWLDEEEDLIQTDRRDILWSHPLGQAFEKWGQKIVLKIGNISRTPMKKKVWERFQEISDVENKILTAFPLEEQKPIRERAFELAKMFGQTIREDELEDGEQVENLIQLSLSFAPHITLDKTLREAGEAKDTPLGVITGILKTARVAELSSFGRIADDRIKVIKKIEELKDDPTTLESAFQNLITQAPWLINPQWSPITANQSFSTLKKEFQKFYHERTGETLELDDFSDPTKRMDFVLSSQDNEIQIIEIKRPSHNLENEEMARINKYIELMDEFLQQPGAFDFLKVFGNYHVTLVCDGLNLTGLAKAAFDGFVNSNKLTHINWTTFLLRTRKMHEEFMQEAERQKRDVAQPT